MRTKAKKKKIKIIKRGRMQKKRHLRDCHPLVSSPVPVSSRAQSLFLQHVRIFSEPSSLGPIKHKKNMRRFYTTKPGNVVRITPPQIKPSRMVKPNPNINNMPFLRSDPITNKPAVPWQKLPHIRTDRLPEKAIDIKGTDTSAHQFFLRRPVFGKIPTLFTSKYFTLTFIPQIHVISSLRKSNVAYTFTNYGGPNFNSAELQKGLVAYRGEYRSLEFFKSVHSPMGTAVSRSNFRKLVKRALYKALHQVVPNEATEVEKIAGIFHFRFNRYPVPSERNAMREDVLDAVTKLYTNQAYQRSLLNIIKKQNQQYPNVRMLARDIRPENMLGAKSMPGYFPKLPYFHETAPSPKRIRR